MRKNLMLSVVLAALLAACTSKPVKEETKAPVEDRTATTATQPANPGGNADTSGLDNKPAAVTDNGNKAVNPLTDPGNILSKRSVYFDYDKDEVKSEFRPLLEAHARYLLANPAASVILQGNTDERGSREYNLALGQRRAAAVKKVLNVYGVGDKQIETVSFGEEKPKATGNDEAAFSQNRRADIVYSGE